MILVALDFILGIIAAIKMKTFRLSYISDFLRTDVAFKLVPWFAFYVLALVAGNVDIVIPGLDLGFIAGTIYVTIVATWVGSILNSLKEIGFPLTKEIPASLAGSENSAPPKD